MDEADLSRMNDIELQKEYGRMKARLSKDGGRDPEGYRRLEAVSEEMDRRRRAVREEYFRDLREETGPLSPLGMECYVCGRTVEQFNDFVRRNAEADFDSIMASDRRLRFLADVHARAVPTGREKAVMRDFLDGCARASHDISFALENRDHLFVLMDGEFLRTFSAWDIDRYRSADADGIPLTAYERDVLGAFFSAFGDGMTVGEYADSMRSLTERFRSMVDYEDDPEGYRRALREKYVEDNTVGCFETGRFGGMRIFMCPVCNGILETISDTEDRLRRRMGKSSPSDGTTL